MVRVLTRADIGKLGRFVRDQRTSRPRMRPRHPEVLGSSPDRYIVGTGEGITSCRGTADCQVYRLNDGTLEAVDGLTVLVTNPDGTDIPASSYALAVRDKFGQWVTKKVFECPQWYCVEAPESTGTGTDIDCGSPTCWVFVLSSDLHNGESFPGDFQCGSDPNIPGILKFVSTCRWGGGGVCLPCNQVGGSNANLQYNFAELVWEFQIDTLVYRFSGELSRSTQNVFTLYSTGVPYNTNPGALVPNFVTVYDGDTYLGSNWCSSC